MAENNAGREERPETGSEEETSSRDYSTGSEGTVGEDQGIEEERIALAIEGKGEFLSEELKKLLREIEVVQGLRAGALGEEIEARLRGVTEPSVEKLREALREEIEKLEERFHVRRGRDIAGGRSEDLTRIETGEVALRGNNGGVLEGVGPLLQQADAVRAGSDVRDYGYQEDPALRV
jgi:hypothetical protein